MYKAHVVFCINIFAWYNIIKVSINTVNWCTFVLYWYSNVYDRTFNVLSMNEKGIARKNFSMFHNVSQDSWKNKTVVK